MARGANFQGFRQISSVEATHHQLAANSTLGKKRVAFDLGEVIDSTTFSVTVERPLKRKYDAFQTNPGILSTNYTTKSRFIVKGIHPYHFSKKPFQGQVLLGIGFGKLRNRA